ncbi:MAG: hypothetical protein ACI3Z9_04920 [Candidatus Onthomorpha sp.]
MKEFYLLCEQIDIWEKDLQQEMEQFEVVKSDCNVATDEEKDSTGLFYKVYSKSLNGTIEVCLN